MHLKLRRGARVPFLAYNFLFSISFKVKISYLEFFFWKYYFGFKTFLYSSTRSSGHYQRFFLIFRFSSRKFHSQQKLAKKITHFTNLNSLDFINFSANIFWFGVRKTFALLHFLTPRTAFLKHIESKCLDISAYLHKKIFVPKT